MSDEPTSPAASKRRLRARWPLWLGVGGGVAMLAVLLAGESLYLARRALGREAVIGWLRERGIEADLTVESLEIDGFTGQIRIGPASNPEVFVDRAEVRYRLLGFWNGRPLGVEVGEVRLVRPLARASWRQGKFSMGSLDRLLAEFSKAPPRPDARQPKITVEEGRFVLTTDYGLADLRGDARLDNGKLLNLSAGLAPTVMKVGDLTTALTGGRLSLVTRGDRVALTGELAARSLAVEQAKAEDLRVVLVGELPYPDLKAQRGDGRVALSAQATAGGVAAPQLTASRLAWDGRFDGEARGWIETLDVDGRLSGFLRAEGVKTGDLALADVVADTEGPAGFDAKDGASLRLASSVRSRGAWTALGPPLKADDPTIAGLKRFLDGFELSAPGLDLTVGQGVTLAATRPIRIVGRGGEAIVSAHPGVALYDGPGGGLRLAVRGAALPTVAAEVPRYSLTPGGAVAATTLSIEGSLALLRDAEVASAGRLILDGGAVSYVAAGCSKVSLARMELGANDVERLSGALCPVDAPLLTLVDGAWRVRARAEGLAAAAPFLEARVTDGAGTFDLGGEGEAFRAQVTIAGARVIDAAAATRFNPVGLTGAVGAEAGQWRGELAVADGAGRRLATARLQHADAAGRGGIVFDTGELVMAEGGLQPGSLSPLAAPIASPAVGRVRFQGRMDWAGEATTSEGTLSLDDVGFRSPAGAISGIDGRIAFTSLAPLVSAPNQRLTAERLTSIVPVTDIAAAFELGATQLKLQSAQVTVGGGQVRLEPSVIPITAPPAPWEGRLRIEGVQLSDLVEASPFADRVDVDARVSGAVPFVVTPEGVRVIEGKLAAVQPGRISIRREALTGVSAEGGATAVAAEGAPIPVPAPPPPAPDAPPPNTITDFAYQAMEHLAFDTMDVTLNSLPAGRLGALFNIRGRHEPPQRQELRLSWIDLLTRRFLQKSLPLPSGTPVNLTLDSSLNLDEVLRDVAGARALPPAGSQTVQP